MPRTTSATSSRRLKFQRLGLAVVDAGHRGRHRRGGCCSGVGGESKKIVPARRRCRRIFARNRNWKKRSRSSRSQNHLSSQCPTRRDHIWKSVSISCAGADDRGIFARAERDGIAAAGTKGKPRPISGKLRPGEIRQIRAARNRIARAAVIRGAAGGRNGTAKDGIPKVGNGRSRKTQSRRW